MRFAIGLMAVLALGCGKKNERGADPSTKESSAASASLVEVFERGSVAWNVSSNGEVLAHVHHNTDGDISKDSKGSIVWSENGEVKTAELVYSADRGALVAKGPALEADLTEIRYTLTVQGGDPVQGALHVPADGSEMIVADAKASASVSVDGVVAPHGGVIQVVGDQRIEIVGDDDSDEVRVYVLDTSWKPVTVVEHKITIAVGGPKPEVIVLAPAPDGLYFVGHWHVVGEPPRVTVYVKHKGKAHVCIVGYRPGVKLYVNSGPKVKVKVKGVAWGPKADVKIKGGGPAMVKIDIKDKGPKGKVKIKIK
jgi:hypothetical protein